MTLLDGFDLPAWGLASLILIGAAVLDYCVGDPKHWLHPVQCIGWAIARGSELILQRCPGSRARRWAGCFLGLGIIMGSGLLAWGLVKVTGQISPVLAIAVQIIGVASCLAGRSLAQAARSVMVPLQNQDLVTARQALSQFVGRDTDQLNETDILRATVESVAENTVDGVTAPLFYALLGAAIPIIGPWPLAIAYKAASTLDSMIGYRREPYTDLGWFSAQLEDRLTWFPCRLTVLMLAILSGKPRKALQICRRDGPQDPSPNSGWSEGIYAAILGVQLGGDNLYQGVVKSKPLLGEAYFPLTLNTVEQALSYSRWVFLGQLSVGLLAIGVWGYFSTPLI
jgi:adenosylcobinamide-phosphate synthase